MRKKRRTQSHSNFGYYGFGNVSSVFNRKPKAAFEKIRSIYGDEMERLTYDKKVNNKFHQELTEEEKEDIRRKVRATFKKAYATEGTKNILLFCVVIAIFLISYYLFSIYMK